MNTIEKIKSINDEIQKIEIVNELDFFTYTLPNKLKELLSLAQFNIDNKDFQRYLNHQIWGIDFAIDVSVKTKINESAYQKEKTIEIARLMSKTLLRSIDWAFEYYMIDKSLLLEDKF